jgi:hypothetical protein
MTTMTKTEGLRRLRAGAALCRNAARLPKNWKVEVGARTVTVVSYTLPAKGQVYATGDDLTSFFTLSEAAPYVEYGEVVHVYFSSIGYDGEMEDICCVWLGTPDQEPVLLDINGRYVAREEAA